MRRGDLAEERERRAAAGQPESFTEEDLYPDARPCLAALRESGLRVGLAGNQTARAETILRALDLPVDVIGASDGWGVEKPSAAFFERVVAEAGCPAAQVLYVGDRLDNDIGRRRRRGSRPPWCVAARGATSSATGRSAPAACSSSTRWPSCPTSYASTTSRPANHPEEPPGRR